MKTQPGAGIAGLETVTHEPSVHSTRSAELGHLLEEIVVRGKEEREARRELVDAKASGKRARHVLDRVREGECQLLNRRRARFTDVISRYGDWIPARHLGGA